MQNQLLDWVEENRRRTARKLKSMVQETFGVEVHERTMKIFLQNKGFFSGVCARKLLSREMNKVHVKRIAFTREHENKSNELWQSV